MLAMAVSRLQSGGGMNAMMSPAAGIVLLSVLRAGCEAWSAGRLYTRAREYLSQWRRFVVVTLNARSPLDHERIPAGAAASVLAEQAEAVLPWLTRYQSAAWRVRIVPLLILLPVAWHSWVAAVVLMLAAPVIPLFMAIVGWRAKAASEEQWLQLSSMNAFLLDRLRGLATLRALGSIDLTAHRLRDNAEDLRRRTMRVLRIAFLSSAVLELFAALGVALVAVYIGFHLLGQLNFGTWGRQLTLAQGLFVLLLAPAFFDPLRELATVWHDRAAGEAAMDALRRLGAGGLAFTNDPEVARPAKQERSTVSRRSGAPGVEVKGLSFAFPGQAPLFQNLDLYVAPGEHVALVGGSGAGKTVLLSLLAGLIPAASGDIHIDGTRMAPGSLAQVRRRVGWMGQRPHVFAGSVQHNVALGREGVGKAEVLHAIQLARLADVAQAHPGVTLGEGGSGLSGGESARLALARLAAGTQADLLLLDEPTAHLDGETAALVAQSLKTLATGRTMIVATHDPMLAAAMDRIIQIPSLRQAPSRNGGTT